MPTGRVTKEKAAASVEPGGDLRLESLAASSAGVAARAACSRAASVFTSSDSGAITATSPSSRVTPRGSSSGSASSPAGLVARLARRNAHRQVAEQLLGKIDGQRLSCPRRGQPRTAPSIPCGPRSTWNPAGKRKLEAKMPDRETW